MPLTLSAVVCAYTDERWDDIVAAVRSLQAQEPAPAEILLVIDTNPALLLRAEAHFAEGVRVIANTQSRGLSGARNSGVAAATGDVIAFLDDDATARAGWASGTLSWFEKADVVGVGGSAIPSWPVVRPRWFPREFDWVVGCSYTGLPTAPSPVRNPIGCNMAFRAASLALVDGFDTSIGRIGKTPLGCEETELSIRVRRATGGTIVYDPGVVVDHRVTAARTTIRYFRRRCWSEGLSKALVRSLVGADDALASERTYVAVVLPRGVAAGLLSPPFGWARAAVIGYGLATTAAGYVVGMLRAPMQAKRRLASGYR